MPISISNLFPIAFIFPVACAWRDVRRRPSGETIGDFSMQTVSYCQDDHGSKDVVTFIARPNPGTNEHLLYAFKSEGQAATIMTDLSHAFMKV